VVGGSAEWIGDPDPGVVLAVAHVLGQDLVAAIARDASMMAESRYDSNTATPFLWKGSGRDVDERGSG